MYDLSLLTKEEIFLWILGIIAAYFIGNISPSILISRAAGFDIRSKGSGNAGTTNMLRTMGKKAAILTLFIDVSKGVIAVMIGRHVGGEPLAILCGLAVFIGHIWPLVFGFRGGKGIATSLGLLITIFPPMGLICLGIAALGILISRRVSVGALMAAASLPVLAYYYLPTYVPIFAVMAIIVFIKHRSNISRLIKGQEPKISLKK